MAEGRYKFCDNNILVFSDECLKQKAFDLCGQIKKIWKKAYKPDMELTLFE